MNIQQANSMFDILVKMATPLGVVIMLYLQSQFVTRSEFVIGYDKIDKRIAKIEEVLIRMEAGAMIDAQHSALLADHEKRLRAIEIP